MEDPPAEYLSSISFREPMTEAERHVVSAEDMFDLESSFDLSYFGVERETVLVIMKELRLPNRFLAIVRDLRDESLFSHTGNWQNDPERKWMSKLSLVLPIAIILG